METSQKFTYTADRQSYTSIVGVFAGLTLVEGAVFGALVAFFVPAPYKFIVLGLLAALFLFALVKIFSELWTHHSLTDSELKLRYGLDLATNIPRTKIVTAKPFDETTKKVRKKSIMDLGVRYDTDHERLVAAFSQKGQILLTLSEKQSFRYGLTRQAETDKLLINVDKRDEFLAALTGVTSEEKPGDLVKES